MKNNNNVYLDTSIYIKYKYDLKHSDFIKLEKLHKDNKITILYTDITKKEVIKNFSENYKIISQSKLNLPTKYKEKLVEQINNDFSYIKNDYWKNKKKLDISKVNIDNIINDHFELNPPFSAGKKENEFKDSIVLNTIFKFAEDTFSKIFIISSDLDWQSFDCSKNMIFINSLSELLSNLENTEFIYRELLYFNEILNEYFWEYAEQIYYYGGVETDREPLIHIDKIDSNRYSFTILNEIYEDTTNYGENNELSSEAILEISLSGIIENNRLTKIILDYVKKNYGKNTPLINLVNYYYQIVENHFTDVDLNEFNYNKENTNFEQENIKSSTDNFYESLADWAVFEKNYKLKKKKTSTKTKS